MASLYGYYTGPLARTFDQYNDIDDLHFTGAHDMIKLRKHGYGRATDDACREIRFGRMTRAEAAAAVRVYESNPPADIAPLADFMGVSERDIHVGADAQRRSGAAAKGAMNRDPHSDGLRPSMPTCIFRTNVPRDFTGDARQAQLLTRGYGRE